jgi:hypothetical protein
MMTDTEWQESQRSYNLGFADGYANRAKRPEVTAATPFDTSRENGLYSDGYADGTQTRRDDIADGTLEA